MKSQSKIDPAVSDRSIIFFVFSKKKIRNILHFSLILSVLLLAPSRARSETFTPFKEAFPNGKIDWDRGVFYGVGIGYPHLNKGSKARALKVAQAGALSAILQVASGLRIDDKHTLSDLEKNKVIIQIKGLIYYEPHERRFIKEGKPPFFRVTYRAPMKGVKGLTRKLFPLLRSHPTRSGQDFPRQEALDDSDELSPWLVLDARGIARHSQVRPAVFPRIVTDDGMNVYDLDTVEEEALVERGMARYVASDKSHEEMGFMPGMRPFFGLRDLFSPRTAHAKEKRKRRGKYIVKTVKQAQGIMKTNLVISKSDAEDIKAEDASSRILKKCRVIVIVSSSLAGIEGRFIDHFAFYR